MPSHTPVKRAKNRKAFKKRKGAKRKGMRKK